MLRRLMIAGGDSGGGGASDILAKLASWWTFDDTMNDAHGTNHLVNGPAGAYAAGKKGSANNNTKRYSNTPTGISGFHTSGCSVWFWFFPTDATTRVLLSLGRLQSAGELLSVDYVGGAIGGGYQDSGSAIGPTPRFPAALNTWHFVVLSWEPNPTIPADSLVRLWVDGVARTAKKTPGSALTPQYFEVGSRYSTSWPLGGVMDEMGFSISPLTDEQIAWLYNDGAGRSYSEL